MVTGGVFILESNKGKPLKQLMKVEETPIIEVQYTRAQAELKEVVFADVAGKFMLKFIVIRGVLSAERALLQGCVCGFPVSDCFTYTQYFRSF